MQKKSEAPAAADYKKTDEPQPDVKGAEEEIKEEIKEETKEADKSSPGL